MPSGNMVNSLIIHVSIAKKTPNLTIYEKMLIKYVSEIQIYKFDKVLKNAFTKNAITNIINFVSNQCQ